MSGFFFDAAYPANKSRQIVKTLWKTGYLAKRFYEKDYPLSTQVHREVLR